MRKIKPLINEYPKMQLQESRISLEAHEFMEVVKW